jgi:hypothetical protein
MKKIFLILISFFVLTGCAQNYALLGPAFSIVNTGGIQQALISESVNYGIKSKTGKNVSEHVVHSLTEETKLQKCNNDHNNSLQEIFFNSLEDINCEKIQ